jgi:hypothetical protein
MKNHLENDPAYRKMKENQAWEMAGLARQDGDHVDERHWTREAQKWAQPNKEIS